MREAKTSVAATDHSKTTYRIHAQYHDRHAKPRQLYLRLGSSRKQGLDLSQTLSIELQPHGPQTFVRMPNAHMSIRQRKTAHVARRRGQIIFPRQLQKRLPEIRPAIGREEIAKGHMFLEGGQVHFGWGPDGLQFAMNMVSFCDALLCSCKAGRRALLVGGWEDDPGQALGALGLCHHDE